MRKVRLKRTKLPVYFMSKKKVSEDKAEKKKFKRNFWKKIKSFKMKTKNLKNLSLMKKD